METKKFYAPPKVDMIALNTEQGFAQSFASKNEVYNIFNNDDSGVKKKKKRENYEKVFRYSACCHSSCGSLQQGIN